MAEKAKLKIVLDENGIHTEIMGKPADMMFLANMALQETEKALKKCPVISDEDALSLMDEVVESYQIQAHYGKDVADLRAIMQIIKHS